MFGRTFLSLFLLLACSPSRHPTASASPSQPAPEAPTPSPATSPAHQHASQSGFHKDFSDAEAFAKHFDDPARDAWQRPGEVVEHLRIAPGQVIVDLGAGTGYFLPILSSAVGSSGQVLALDVESKMIELMEKRVREQKLGNVTPRRVAADDPGLSRGSVARVLIVNTWHHLDRRADYARKLAEALASAGEIWIVDFTLDSDLGPPRRHRLAAEQVVRELEQGGLRAEVVAPEQLPKQYLVRAWRP